MKLNKPIKTYRSELELKGCCDPTLEEKEPFDCCADCCGDGCDKERGDNS